MATNGDKREYESDEPAFTKTKHLKPENETENENKIVRYNQFGHLRLEQSIFGTKPTEDIVRLVSNLLFENGKLDNIEIEGKVGLLIDRNTKKRVELGVLTETILKGDSWFSFNSDMTVEQHAYFNKLFNSRYNQTQHPEYKGSRIIYRHTKQVDRFYMENGMRVRASVDKETGNTIQCISKRRIANFDIYSPRTKLDYRITINQEIPAVISEGAKVLSERHKDRISYKHDIYSFDLTMATLNENTGSTARRYVSDSPKQMTSYELELEIFNTDVFLSEFEKAKSQKQNNFNDIVQSFINNLRVLVKNFT